jgi:hypothetical protein
MSALYHLRPAVTKDLLLAPLVHLTDHPHSLSRTKEGLIRLDDNRMRRPAYCLPNTQLFLWLCPPKLRCSCAIKVCVRSRWKRDSWCLMTKVVESGGGICSELRARLNFQIPLKSGSSISSPSPIGLCENVVTRDPRLICRR